MRAEKEPLFDSSSADFVSYLEAYPFPAFVFTTRPCPRFDGNGIVGAGGSSPPPLSAPKAEIVWSNARWHETCQGRAFTDCVSPGTFVELEEWLQHGDNSPLSVTLSPNTCGRKGLCHLYLTKVPSGNAHRTVVTSVPLPSNERQPHVVRHANGDTLLQPQPLHQSQLLFPSPASSPRAPLPIPFKSPSWSSGSHVPGDDKSQSESLSSSDCGPIEVKGALQSAGGLDLGSTAPSDTSPVNSGRETLGSPATANFRNECWSISSGPSGDSSSASSRSRVRKFKKHQPSRVASVQLAGGQAPRPSRHSPSENFTKHDLNLEMKSAGVDFTRLLETTDWSKSRLGPLETWPAAVKTAAVICFHSATQDSIWFGDVNDIHVLYNKNYSQMLNHPHDFGKPASEVWPSLWPQLEPLARGCYEGNTLYHHNDLLLYKRNERGHFDERYHTWSWAPIRDGDKIVGLYNMSLDNTSRVIADRRFDTARELIEEVAFAHTREKFFTTVADVLKRNPMDIPFAMCYSVTVEGNTAGTVECQLKLASTVGVPPDHPSAQDTVRVTIPQRPTGYVQLPGARSAKRQTTPSECSSGSSSGSSGSCGVDSPHSSSGATRGSSLYSVSYDTHTWPIARSLATGQCIVVDNCSELVKGFSVRQWDALPEQALVVPIGDPCSKSESSAVLILGVNLYASIDQAYMDWMQVLRGHLTTALTSVSAFEAEVSQRIEWERLEQAKTTWFQGAAHEFRTPLALIAGPLDDVLHSDLRPKQRHALTLASRNVQRLERLVSTLLDFVRIEAGRLTPHFCPGDLGEFVSNIASLFRPAVERLNITFTVDIERKDDLIVFDPVLLEMVVSNLLSNALKYTCSGSISVSVSYDGPFADIAISDTGMGVAPEEVDHIVEMFHRSATAVRSGTAGTGIGLALTKEIARLHGGDLYIESSTGVRHGSTFTAHIPTSQVNVEDAGIPPANVGSYGRQAAMDAYISVNTPDSDMSSTSSGERSVFDYGRNSPSSTLPTEVSETTIATSAEEALSETLMFEKTDMLLIVDDNLELRSYIKSIFEPFVTVLEAGGGTEALEIVRRHRPHLILSDLLMPRVSGLDLLQYIRSDTDPTIRYIPMILLSAINDDETRLEGLMAGAEEYISKPFRRHELIARVHLHMQVGKKRANLEQLFAQREKEIAILSDYCPSGILRLDAKGRLTYANAAFRIPAGLGPDDDLDLWSMWATLCDADTSERLEGVWHDLMYGPVATVKVVWKWLTGCTMSGVFIRLDQVSPGTSGIIACVTDISYQEQRLLEAESRRVMAEEAKRQQELLVDVTSHEIRTPVSAILQCSALVKENLLSLHQELSAANGFDSFLPTQEILGQIQEDVSALDSIYQCGLVQERIAGDILSLARIQLDMLSLSTVAMDIRNEVRKALSAFTIEARMKDIDLELVFGATMDALGISRLKTDPVRLGQVITNLISNAIRFTANSQERRVTITADVSLQPPEPGACRMTSASDVESEITSPEDTPVFLFISVQDTGPGMPEEEKDILFQRFHQGNKMIHTHYGGSGLGLFICKKITELLGGNIEVETEVGRGSIFRFYIAALSTAPLPPEPLSDSTAPSPRAQESPSLYKTPSGHAAEPGLHVLIAEDNIINQTVLKRQLLKAGFTCDTANNGEEAVNAVLTARVGTVDSKPARPAYDVVLMDVEMPIMDGVTALRLIREAEEEGRLQKHQLVIALTGNAREGQIEEAREAGMDGVVIKPYRLPQLIDHIRQLVADQAMADRDIDQLSAHCRSAVSLE